MSELVRGVAQVGTVLRAPKTAELIATHLRRQIVKGDLKPGETLPSEVNLMEQFGVSRPTLREAFRILEVESLIGVRRGSRGGAQVLEPDPMVAARHVGFLLQIQGTTVQDVYEARTLTEPLCAAMLARVRTDDDLDALRAVVDALRNLVAAGFEKVPDIAEWSRTTYRFHEAILQRCGNKTLAVQGSVLADIVDAHLQQALAKGLGERDNVPERYQKTLRSYARLIDLVDARDSDGAEKHWRKHMEVAAGYLFLHDKKNTPIVDLFG
ncbi:FadR/GntR family transcriptional regulator [Nocardioides panzhihuensis]|uniref:DNA-binding FadR family transcriptional regulator n=1 Tax=Nocardioides panzhihuensis TaxID=860243 RepID=A0A7Z0DHL5_9ACTN|nr:FCD domain-containing protein [Nocardioides panzhihuensis]NYI75510.1 DNA-binding FadR family transcriptional regulator [Nocardioides panzhihuensis]